MLNQQPVAGGQSSDLLAVFDSIQTNNEEKILAEDKQFCEQLQFELYNVLNHLKEWYIFFKDKETAYQDIYKPNYKEDGSVEIDSELLMNDCENHRFIKFEFIPFKAINQIVSKYNEAINLFSNEIISYFNKKYHISVPRPNNNERVVWGSRPTYQYLVDLVMGYLRGCNFREAAENEILNKFHKAAAAWALGGGEIPFLKEDKIAFPKVVFWDTFYKKYSLTYDSQTNLEHFFAGIALGSDNTIYGSSWMIIGFDENDVELSSWYELATDNAKKLKFYKNGRIDVKFNDKQMAQECFQRLKLDQFKLKDKKE